MFRFPQNLVKYISLRGSTFTGIHRYFPSNLKLNLTTHDFQTQTILENYLIVGENKLTLGKHWLNYTSGLPLKSGLSFGFASPPMKLNEIKSSEGWGFISQIFDVHPTSQLEFVFRETFSEKIHWAPPQFLRIKKHVENEWLSFTVSCGKEIAI